MYRSLIFFPNCICCRIPIWKIQMIREGILKAHRRQLSPSAASKLPVVHCELVIVIRFCWSTISVAPDLKNLEFTKTRSFKRTAWTIINFMVPFITSADEITNWPKNRPKTGRNTILTWKKERRCQGKKSGMSEKNYSNNEEKEVWKSGLNRQSWHFISRRGYQNGFVLTFGIGLLVWCHWEIKRKRLQIFDHVIGFTVARSLDHLRKSQIGLFTKKLLEIRLSTNLEAFWSAVRPRSNGMTS